MNKGSTVAEMGDRLAIIGMGRKVRGCCAPFLGVAGTPSYTVSPGHLDPSNCLAAMHHRYRQDRQTGQRSRSIGRTVTCNGRPKILLMSFYSPQMVATVNTTKCTIENDLTRKEKNKKKTYMRYGAVR